MDTSEDPPATQGKHCRADDLHPAFVADIEVVQEHAQWRDPGTRAHWDVAKASPLDGVDAAISVWAVDEGRTHAASVKAAKDCELEE